MIGDTQLNIRRESQSTPWLTDIVWSTARRLGYQRQFLAETAPIEDDHVPFLHAGVPAVDIIDLDYPAWHTAADTLDNVSARSLQIVGDVVLAALPDIEQRLGWSIVTHETRKHRKTELSLTTSVIPRDVHYW